MARFLPPEAPNIANNPLPNYRVGVYILFLNEGGSDLVSLIKLVQRGKDASRAYQIVSHWHQNSEKKKEEDLKRLFQELLVEALDQAILVVEKLVYSPRISH